MGSKTAGNRSVKTFNRIECIQYMTRLLGSSRTSFGPSQLTYALAVADEAESLYLSRFRAAKQALPESKQLNAELVWITALLSHAQLFNVATFEDIMDKTNAEIAGYISIINPDTRLPIFERIKKYLITLGAGTNLAKLISFARQVAAIKLIGEAPTQTQNPSFLYELAECLKHLHPVTKWSLKTTEEWEECKNIVNAWGFQRLVPWRTSAPFLHWSLDFTREHNDLKQLFELD